MKKISNEEIEYLAKLSRVGLAKGEAERCKTEMENILNYFQKLDGLDVSNIEPTAQVTGLDNILREDEIKRSDLSREEILNNSKNKENGFIKVKTIL